MSDANATIVTMTKYAMSIEMCRRDAERSRLNDVNLFNV